MTEIKRRITRIIAGDRLRGTRDAEGVNQGPDLTGEPTGRPTPENKKIVSRPPEPRKRKRTPLEEFFGIN
jgi:hypothetical protein